VRRRPEQFEPVRVAQVLLALMTLALSFGIGDAVLGRRAAWVALGLGALPARHPGSPIRDAVHASARGQWR
jgi:hypothetical protein